jgi:hypothetical protein
MLLNVNRLGATYEKGYGYAQMQPDGSTSGFKLRAMILEIDT